MRHLRLTVKLQTRLLVAGAACLAAVEAVVEEIVGKVQHSGEYT